MQLIGKPGPACVTRAGLASLVPGRAWLGERGRGAVSPHVDLGWRA